MTDHPSALVSVPVEPTEAMFEAGFEAMARAEADGVDQAPSEIWSAMIAAATAAPQAAGVGEKYGDETADEIVRRWASWINDVSADMEEPEWVGKTHNDVLNERDFLIRTLSLRAPSREPESGAAHYGDPCVKCGIGHDDVPQGPCRGDGITISRERANALLGYLKNGRGPAGWPTTLWCEVQAFIKNIETAIATREEAPAEAGERGVAGVIMDGLWPILGGNHMDAEVWNEIGEVVSSALRAQPPAREDAQPVAWRFRDHPSNGWVYTGLGGRQDGCEVQPLYTHPASDALRKAVEALYRLVAFIRAEKPLTPARAEELGRLLDEAGRAALQAEQGAK